MSDGDLPEDHPGDERQVLFFTFGLNASDESVEQMRDMSDETLEQAIEEYGEEIEPEVFDRLDNVIATADGYYVAVYSDEITELNT